MKTGTNECAIAIAKARFAMLHPFDLDDETWQGLFAQYPAGDVLEAIKKSKHTRDHRPERIYRSLLYWLGLIARDRNERKSPLWPPSDVTRKT